jgi:MFS family permease
VLCIASFSALVEDRSSIIVPSVPSNARKIGNTPNKMIHTPYLPWFGRGFRLRAAITIACQMAFILFGYDQGVFSGIVGNADFLDTFDHPSAALEGIIVSIYNLGCFTGCILTFLLCEKTGRKLAMWIAMGWIIVSARLG